MHRRVQLGVAAVVVAALTALDTTPSGAQEAPTLGFQIEPTEGAPGDEVNGQVDVDDVAAACITDVDALQDRFLEMESIFEETGPGSLMSEYFPTGEFVFENYQQEAFSLIAVSAIGVLQDDAIAADALRQTFVMTFADVATQEPVGERANFDPAIGQATVTVPEVEPGLWAVAATCVEPSLDLDTLRAAIAVGAEYLEGLGIPVDPLELPDLVAFLQEHGPTLLEPVMVPRALGVQFFCVVDANGVCPGGEPPEEPGPQPGPGPEPEPAPQPGPQPPSRVAPPARPVVARPTFTG